MRAREKQAVDRLRLQGRPHLGAAYQGDEHVSGYAGSMQQAGHGQPGQGGVFRWLVQHGVAGQQRRHKHISAHKPGVVPGRDVGHHAQRRVLNLLGHAAVGVHRLGHQAGVHRTQKEVNPAHQAVELVARHLDRLAGLAGHDGGQRFQLGPHRRSKALDAGFALGQGRGRPGGLGGAGPASFSPDRGGIVGLNGGDQGAGGRVVNGKLVHTAGDGGEGSKVGEVLAARQACRKSVKSGVSSSVPSSGR